MALFELNVEVGPEQGVARLRLTNECKGFLASRTLCLADHPPSLWEGLFDLRRYVQQHENAVMPLGSDRPATAEELVDRIGTFLGREVLGPEIMGCLLADGNRSRTLLVRLPAPESGVLAASFARVPWEIARTQSGAPPLVQRNLVVRATASGPANGAAELSTVRPEPDEALRVLLVFPEAAGPRRLALRHERDLLLELFHQKVMPYRRVQVDVLSHGLTQGLLSEQIRSAGGYHVVHWSGHGLHNSLEVPDDAGQPQLLTGAELAEIFHDAGGFYPDLVFLSACLSGTFITIKNWADLQAALSRTPHGEKRSDAKDAPEAPDQPGYTGTALALLEAGVGQVVAMRYEVEDSYARNLAVGFYRHLLADAALHPADTALSLARSELLGSGGRFPAVSHTTPLLFGRGRLKFQPHAGRSEQLDRLRPQPQPLLPASRELEPSPTFVGRSTELTALAREWLGDDGPAVALIQGLAGMGKTSLAAEAIHLWHSRFDYVLCFQAKPSPVRAEDLYSLLDQKLRLCSRPYVAKVERQPNAAVYLPPGGPLKGDARYAQMRVNLVEALRTERVLLVLDNWETNLDSVGGPDGYPSADPEMDRLLAALAEDLPGTGSRLLVTSRHRLRALNQGTLLAPLGPLPIREAVLYIQSHKALDALYHSGDSGKALVLRLLQVSGRHPLIMSRLAALAGDPAALTSALDELGEGGFAHMPDLFATTRSAEEREKEREYLEDVAVRSIDRLIERLSHDARKLLSIIALGFEPVPEPVLCGIWSGEDPKTRYWRMMRQRVLGPESLPDRVRKKWESWPEEKRKEVLEDPGKAPLVPDLEPLLHTLTGTSLVEVGGSEPERVFSCHELVRARACLDLTRWNPTNASAFEHGTRLSYLQWYVHEFDLRCRVPDSAFRAMGLELGRRALRYIVATGFPPQYSQFVTRLVSHSDEPLFLTNLLVELSSLGSLAPGGRPFWEAKASLASALWKAGHVEEALQLYQEAASSAECAGGWADIAWIYENWATALHVSGLYPEARRIRQEVIKMLRDAACPALYVLFNELQLLRSTTAQVCTEDDIHEIETRIQILRSWWQQRRSGQAIPDAPNLEFLEMAYACGLGIAGEAYNSSHEWQKGLAIAIEEECFKRGIGQSKYEISRARYNQFPHLYKLGRLEEAARILEECRSTFGMAGDLLGEAQVLLGLGSIWRDRGDLSMGAECQKQALVIANRTSDIPMRVMCHRNFAITLYEIGRSLDAAKHQLAEFIYVALLGLSNEAATTLGNVVTACGKHLLQGESYAIPDVGDTLCEPQFTAVSDTVARFGVSAAELQELATTFFTEATKLAELWVAQERGTGDDVNSVDVSSTRQQRGQTCLPE